MSKSQLGPDRPVAGHIDLRRLRRSNPPHDGRGATGAMWSHQDGPGVRLRRGRAFVRTNVLNDLVDKRREENLKARFEHRARS